MNLTLLRSLLLLVPASALLAAALVLFRRAKGAGAFLLVVGAGFFLLVVLTHICEALDLLPWMRWGRPDSVGHYLNLCSAILSLTLVSLGYVLTRRRGRRLTSA